MPEYVNVWAPATVANWGPGYDLMGAAVQGMGDRVEARKTPGTGKVFIDDIHGDDGQLTRDPDQNTAGIACRETLRRVNRDDIDVHLVIHKGLPMGSGLGSSGASAVAAAWAVNLLCDQPVQRIDLLDAVIQAEAAVSGWHADNVAPGLLGGFALIQSYDPLQVISLTAPESLWLTLVTPQISVSTKAARRVVPKTISIQQHIANSGHLAAMISALCRKDTKRFGRAIRDQIVEPARSSLIPGFHSVQEAATQAGAYGCSISGAGPTIFAVSQSEEAAQNIASSMQNAFLQAVQLESDSHVARIDNEGVRAL